MDVARVVIVRFVVLLDQNEFRIRHPGVRICGRYFEAREPVMSCRVVSGLNAIGVVGIRDIKIPICLITRMKS